MGVDEIRGTDYWVKKHIIYQNIQYIQFTKTKFITYKNGAKNGTFAHE